MDLIHKRGAAWELFVTVLVLAGTGVVMVYSASAVVAQAQYHDSAWFLKRQLLYTGIGLAGMSVAWRLHYAKLRLATLPLLGFTCISLLLVLAPHIGREAGGARRWLAFGGPLNFQPAELAKLAIILYLANFLANRGERTREFGAGMLPPLIVLAVLAVPIVKQPDLGSALILALITFVLLFIGGARVAHLAVAGAVASGVVMAVIMHAGYRAHRFFAFLDPWKDPRGAGFHIIQSLLALGSGSVFGLGLGHSRQKFFYLPERHTDFIFSIIGEELGLVGTAAVITLFLLLAVWGYRIASRAPDRYSALLTSGLTTMIVGQAVVNIGVVSGLLPITGVPLPFISFGGSSLVLSYIAVGILLNISQYAHEEERVVERPPDSRAPAKHRSAWARG
ncbi:MAG TPA: putative lipid II flippase FtsW [bacterium]|nr:putative lipid II flippase FtsW [bacterium]